MTDHKIIRGAIWASVGSWGGALVSLLIFVVTARLLGPDAFGVMALGWLVLTFPDLFLNKTVSETLIQKDDLRAGHTNSFFWVAVLSSFVFAALIALLAPPIAAFFDSADFGAILPIFGGLLILVALKAVPMALMRRAMRFKELAVINLVALVFAGATGITMAVLGFGVWSLVALAYVEYLVSLVVVWRLAGWRPTGFVHWASIAEMTPFARNTFAAALITQAAIQFPRFAIGAFLGVGALGIYMIAWNTFERLSALLMAPVRNVALPAITETRSEIEMFRQTYVRVLSFSAQVTYPVYIGAAAVAPLAIPLLFGPQWMESGLLAQIILFIGLRSGVTELNSAVIKGFDRTDLTLVLSSVNLVINVALVMLAIPFGLAAVALAVLARRFLTWPLSIYFVTLSCGLSMRKQFVAGLPALCAVLTMFGAVLGTGSALTEGVPDLAKLTVMIGVGIVVYGAISFVLAKEPERAAYKHAVGGLLSGDFGSVKRYLFS